MRLLSNASITVIIEVKGPRHCSTTGCPVLDWKNYHIPEQNVIFVLNLSVLLQH